MVKRTGPTSYVLRRLIRTLSKASVRYNTQVWRALSEKLEAPSRKRSAVNLSKIGRYAKNGDFIAVPGKVLGLGEIKCPITVAAVSFSSQAKKKIEAAGGRCLTIDELVLLNPRGSNVRIIG